MNWKYKDLLALFQKGDHQKLLTKSLHGLERECLRVDQKGQLSQKPHPEAFGSPLTHEYLTTDFAEAQLELITPPFQDDQESQNFLRALHCFINTTNSNELIWPFSMPPRLPNEKDIKIAEYGPTDLSKKRTQYREGLAARYGKKMQTVSGTHYNFSFAPEFWKFLHKKFAKAKQSEQDFRSESYLHLMRNFLRLAWINTYLFGAAPAIDKTYLKSKPAQLKRHGWNTYYGLFATSIRMSNLGYYSKVQSQLNISYNSLEEYLERLQYAISTPSPSYKNFPGLNENLLQGEAEHYSRIRPKCSPQNNERPINALRERGIQYVEVRTLDINPFATIGIDQEQIRFLHICLIYCLFKPSPKISETEAKIIRENQNLVAVEGRKPNLELQTARGPVPFAQLAHKLLTELNEIAELLDKAFKTDRYTHSLALQQEKVSAPDSLPSSRLLHAMFKQKLSFHDYGRALALENRPHLDFCAKTNKCKPFLEQSVADSLKAEEKVKIYESARLSGYEDLETSTQILIKRALLRDIQFQILDRKENVVRFTKGKKQEIVQQATLTAKDSVLSYFLMGNKQLSKIILAEKGLSVPQGRSFTKIDQALAYYEECRARDTIVKPTHTNYGIAVSLVHKNQPKAYQQAVEEAFKHGHSIIVEDFISGKEYRFLTIGDQTVAVCHRIPANVIGDGEHNISELVDLKNATPKSYKFLEKYQMAKGKVEAAHLKKQGLTFNSIPKKGQQIFLRENSNVSTGGDPLDYTEEVHQFYKDIALKAARAAEVRFCGIDMIIPDTSKPGDYSIIEINFNPALHIHCFPVNKPKPTFFVADLTLDELGF